MRMSVENVDASLVGILYVGTHVPHAQTIVHRIRGHMSALGIHGQTGDRIGVAGQRIETLGARFTHVPHSQVVVDAGRDELVFGGAEAHGQHLKGLIVERDCAARLRDALAAIPHSDGAIVRGRGEHVRRVTCHVDRIGKVRVSFHAFDALAWVQVPNAHRFVCWCCQDFAWE